MFRSATTTLARPISSIATSCSRSSSRFSRIPTRQKVGHHLKYDAHVLANCGIELRGMRYDSMLESYVLNSTAINHNMDSTAAKYLGVKTIRYEDVAGRGARQLTFNQVPVDRAAEYSAEDADVTLQLHRALWSQLEAVPSLKRVV